jgi:hypothetical protein
MVVAAEKGTTAGHRRKNQKKFTKFNIGWWENA